MFLLPLQSLREYGIYFSVPEYRSIINWENLDVDTCNSSYLYQDAIKILMYIKYVSTQVTVLSILVALVLASL